MSKSVTIRAIQATSKAAADVGLTDAGFRRQGNHLHRLVDGVFHAINFQGSQWGSASSGSFTVNLVVTSPFLHTTWTGRPFPSNPASSLFPLRSRIGRLMPSRRDHWWEVDDRTIVDTLAQEAATEIIQYGLPFFEPFKSTKSMLVSLREGKELPCLSAAHLPLIHAILAVEAGAGAEARGVLERALVGAGASPFRETIQAIGERLGVLVA
jgi:hypothetical protein